MAAYTIENWLRGKVDFDFPQEAITAILFDRNVLAGTEAKDVSERDRELCYADLLMYAAGSSVSHSGEYVSDNGFQLQKSARNIYDRKALRDNALRIYKKYDDAKGEEAKAGTIKMYDLY